MPRTLVLTHSPPGCTDAPAPAFVCSCTNGGLDAAWVHVAGELDIATTPILERTLRRAAGRARLVVLDLRALAFMDGAGVHAIVNAGIRAQRAGRRLVLVRGSSCVDRVFALTGAADDLEIVDIDAVEPPVQALLQLAQNELAS